MIGAAPTKYYLKTDSLYRIWFSDNPDIFLNDENKLRFIRMRLKNPKAKISLIYSSQSLSTRSLKALQVFCQNLKITPVNFETQIPPLLENNMDKKMYALAKEEISRTIRQAGGNLASASDCTRTILPVNRIFGNYSDYDSEVNFSNLHPAHEVKAPLISNITVLKKEGLKLLLCGNDFFGITYDSKELNNVSIEAVKNLRVMQAFIATGYKSFIPHRLLTELTGLPSAAGLYPLSEHIIHSFVKNNPQGNIFDFRMFLHAMSQDSQVSAEIKHSLYMASVTQISGLNALLMIFYEYLKNQFCVGGFATLKIVPELEWEKLLEKASSYSLKDNHLEDSFLSSQNPKILSEVMNNPSSELSKTIGDNSWTASGAQKQNERSQKIARAVKTIQTAFRNRKKKEHPLSLQNHKRKLNPIEELKVNFKIKFISS